MGHWGSASCGAKPVLLVHPGSAVSAGTSVPDPDPHVFGPPGSISQRYGSGSDPDPSVVKQK